MVDKIWYNMEELIGGSEERGINRNILECKVNRRFYSSVWLLVLIETYWNVKNLADHCCRLPSRINRNILECKDALSTRNEERI